jgi:predicted nucleic acid-binding protein
MSLQVAEPPASYLVRPRAVVDASVLAAFIFQEPEAAEAEAQMRPYALAAPSLLSTEIANVAASKLRRQLAPAADLRARLDGFDFTCIALVPTPVAEVFSLAADYGLTAYDAAYLWLAGDLRAPLLTYDSRLAQAARDYLSRLSPE